MWLTRDEQVCVYMFVCKKHHNVSSITKPIWRGFLRSQSPLCAVFVNSQEPEIVLSPRNPGTSSCKVNWYGQSIWFQSLGKLVPWREPSPSSLCWTKTDDRPKKLSQKRMYKQTGINPQANTAVSEAGVASIVFSVFLVLCLLFYSLLWPHNCFL